MHNIKKNEKMKSIFGGVGKRQPTAEGVSSEDEEDAREMYGEMEGKDVQPIAYEEAEGSEESYYDEEEEPEEENDEVQAYFSQKEEDVKETVDGIEEDVNGKNLEKEEDDV